MRVSFQTITFKGGKVRILDQTLLPFQIVYRDLQTVQEVAEAIKNLRVRGAPLIGVTAAYGIALCAKNSKTKDYHTFKKEIESAVSLIRGTRPTAHNLFYALKRMEKIIERHESVESLKNNLLVEAEKMRKEDELLCEKIGENGFELIKDKKTILTHCNAGALATCGIGTALAPIYKAKERGINISVFVPETRPWLQGARLTAWELKQHWIPVTLIVDSARGYVLYKKMVNCCIVGADRIAKNGDVANKIGTYPLAVVAKENNIPFYVAAPSNTFDDNIESGEQINIEQRQENEVSEIQGIKITSDGISVFNPVFDITPAKYITGYITEKGVKFSNVK